MLRPLAIAVITLGVSSACQRAGGPPVAARNDAAPERATATGADGVATPAGTAVDSEAARAGVRPGQPLDTPRSITVPAGTELHVALDNAVGSDTSRPEQPVAAHLTRPVVIHGQTVWPAGSKVTGVVTDAVRSGKVKGLAHVAIRFDSVTAPKDAERYRIRTAAVGRTAPATKKKDALEIGAPAAGGALIGALLGGKKGAAIGTVAGGGAGAAVVLSTRGREVHINRGAPLTLKLTDDVTAKVRG